MKIKKGDKVIVIAGKDKGKTGTVHQALPRENKVILDGLNLAKKHIKPVRKGDKGQVVEKPMPIHVSNVALVDPKSGKPTRVRMEDQKGKKVRVATKSGSVIA